MKRWNLDLVGYWVIWASCWIEKDQEPSSSPRNCWKGLLKIVAFSYIYELTKFGDFMSCGLKDIIKNAPYLMH